MTPAIPMSPRPGLAPEKEISGLAKQMSQLREGFRELNSRIELMFFLFDCPKRAEETRCQKTR